MRESAKRLRATLARRLEAAMASGAAARVQRSRAAYLNAVRTAVTGKGDVRVRDHLRARWNGQERELLEQLRAARRAARRAVTGSDSKLVRDFLREEPVVRFVDRVAFTFGVLMLVATEAFLLRWPAAFWAFYAATMPLLLAFRVCQYTALSYQFFMLDFCYFAVAAAGVHATLAPGSAWLGDMVFAWANGPLACAIVVWRNSLVFHSLDKITSAFIHFFPVVLSFCARWYGGVRGGRAACAAGDAHAGVWWGMFAVPLAGYLVWQMLYILVTEVLFRRYLDSDASIQTSLRWLTRDSRNGMHRLVRSAMRRVGVFARDETFEPGTAKTLAVFCGAQFVYTALCLLPPMLLRASFALHGALVAALVLVMVWNGATYYIEVFTVRYRQQFAKLKRRLSQTKSAAEAKAIAAAAEDAAANVEELDELMAAAHAKRDAAAKAAAAAAANAADAEAEEERSQEVAADEALLMALVGHDHDDGSLRSADSALAEGADGGGASPARHRAQTLGVPDAGPHGTPLAGTALTD